MQQCGYSRERATSALMRELSRGDSSRPSDDEVSSCDCLLPQRDDREGCSFVSFPLWVREESIVCRCRVCLLCAITTHSYFVLSVVFQIFDTMRRYGLGIEEASRTIIVSRALRKAMDTHASPAKAIEHLASKIAVKRLLYDSSEEDPTSDDEFPPISANLRVEPISTMERNVSSTRARTAPVRTARLVSNSGKATRPRKAPTPNKPIFRKRSIDEIGSADKSEEEEFATTRARSESVSEEVSAKIAQQSGSGDETPVAESAARPVRAKRSHSRPDDAEPSLTQSSNKRIRSNDA